MKLNKILNLLFAIVIIPAFGITAYYFYVRQNQNPEPKWEQSGAANWQDQEKHFYESKEKLPHKESEPVNQ